MERYLKKDLDLLIFEIDNVFKISQFKKCKNEDAEENVFCFFVIVICLVITILGKGILKFKFFSFYLHSL
jgi:hypothetical protein